MKLLLDFPTIGEPHYAQALPAIADQGQAAQVLHARGEHASVRGASAEAEASIKRTGKRVHVKMIAIRSHFAPDNIEGIQVGDTVYFHVTNIEQDWDILHGFAVLGRQQRPS